jgi:hypothetical protein
MGARGGGGGRGGVAGEQTPLMMAARGDREDVMRALVAAGADPALKAQDGSNVLMAAASGARMKTFAYAFEIDPNVSVVTTTGNTIMHVAVGLNGRTQPEVCEVIQFLADHGAKLDELNGAGRTPIAVADNLPVDTSTLEARLGRRLAGVLNPDIPLPGHLNILDQIDWAQALAPATPRPAQHTWATARANQNRLAAEAATAAALATDDPPPPF